MMEQPSWRLVWVNRLRNLVKTQVILYFISKFKNIPS